MIAQNNLPCQYLAENNQSSSDYKSREQLILQLLEQARGEICQEAIAFDHRQLKSLVLQFKRIFVEMLLMHEEEQCDDNSVDVTIDTPLISISVSANDIDCNEEDSDDDDDDDEDDDDDGD